MAQSTAHKALASLQHKFQSKIREVGALKKQLAELDNVNPTVVNLREILRQYRDNTVKLLAELNLERGSNESHEINTQNLKASIANLKGSVEGWKHFNIISGVIGVAIGSLSTLAYITQVV